MTAQKELRFADGVSVQVGNSGDATFFHTSGNTTLQNGTGNFTIQNLTDDGDLILKSDDGSGGVTAYLTLDGSVGYTQASVNIRFADNAKLQVGASADLELNHDGTDSTISNKTGDLYITNTLDDKDIILRSDDGSGGVTPYLTLDGSATSVNIEQDVKLTATKKLYLDGGGDSFIFEESANNVMFKVGNNNNLRFNSTGAIFNDAGASLDFRVEGDTDDHLFFVDGSADKVGISTNSPEEKLHLKDGNFRVGGDNAGSDYGVIFTPADAESYWHIYNDAGGHLAFGRSATIGSLEKMRIDSSGNVGIGTDNPSSLDANGNRLVIGGGSGNEGLTIFSGTSGLGTMLFADGNDGSNAEYRGWIQYEHTNDSLEFATASAERVRINSSGNVGIGDTNPPNKLSVKGSSTDLLYLEGDGITSNSIIQSATGGSTRIRSAGGKVEFYTGGANNSSSASGADFAMGILDNGSVLIGTTNTGWDGDADNLVVGSGSGNNGMTIYAGSTSFSQINFADSNSGSGRFTGVVRYNHNTNDMSFHTNDGTVAMTIDAQRNLKFADNGTNPSAAANTAFLFNDGGELKVLDELGHTTTISPHNFELIPDGASEDMAFAYHSTKHTPEGKLKKVNVDMMKLARLVEQLTGEKLVYIEEGE
jgi:hypothetical protein